MNDNSGQLITKSLKGEYDDVINKPMHSKEESIPVLLGV